MTDTQKSQCLHSAMHMCATGFNSCLNFTIVFSIGFLVSQKTWDYEEISNQIITLVKSNPTFSEFMLVFLSLQNISQVETISSTKACFLSVDICLDLMPWMLSTALQYSRRVISLPAWHTLALARCTLASSPQPCLPPKVLHTPLRPASHSLGKQKESKEFQGCILLQASWFPKIVTLFNTVHSEHFKLGILSVTEGWCLRFMFHGQWFLMKHHCLSLVPRQWHLT